MTTHRASSLLLQQLQAQLCHHHHHHLHLHQQQQQAARLLLSSAPLFTALWGAASNPSTSSSSAAAGQAGALPLAACGREGGRRASSLHATTSSAASASPAAAAATAAAAPEWWAGALGGGRPLLQGAWQQQQLRTNGAPTSSTSPSPTRSLSTSPQQQHKPSERSKQQLYDSLEITPEKINNAITDKIPERPVGPVEGASYSLIIIAAFAALIFVLYQFVMNFILEPTALQCFNHTLDMLKADPRITVRLGSSDDIRAWGSNSQSRVGRQQIPHQIYQDASGVEHVRIQFYMRGPSGTGLVNADMFKDPVTKQWSYTYLLVDAYTSSSQTPSRVHIVRPQ